ncbi:MAG: metallophosphoesterase family protein, partial [Candidatus Limnocylindrales bacterium]
ENLKVVVKAGNVEMTSAGSTACRAAITKYQPMLGLHGHVHESRGVARLGRTLCANPGSEYTEGILRGFLAELDGDRIKSYQLTSG